MDDVKRKIIVAEIESWKQNQLLPAHYCDFLLNLYTEGESGAREENSDAGRRRRRLPFLEPLKRYRIIFLLFFTALIGIIYLVTHFTDFNPAMQIIFIGFFFIIFLGGGLYLLRRKEGVGHLFVGSAALLLIWLVYLFQVLIWGSTEQGLMPGLLLLIAILWLLIGLLFTIPYLIIGGELALVLSYGIWLYPQLGGESFWVIQMVWLLPLIIIAVILWLRAAQLYRWYPYLILLGILLLFGPELQTLYLNTLTSMGLQIFFFAKLLFTVVLLTFSIKFWRRMR